MINYDELSSVISTEEDAISFLQEKGLVHNPRQCEQGHDTELALGQQQRWCCSKTTCREYKVIRKGTFLQGSKLLLGKIIKFIYFWCEGRSSVKNSKKQREIGVNTHTE